MKNARIILLVLGAISLMFLGGCFDNRTEGEKRIDEMKDDLSEMVDKVGDKVDEAQSKVHEAIDNMSEEVDEASGY